MIYVSKYSCLYATELSNSRFFSTVGKREYLSIGHSLKALSLSGCCFYIHLFTNYLLEKDIDTYALLKRVS